MKLQLAMNEAEAARRKPRMEAHQEQTSALTPVTLTLRLNDLVNNVILMKMTIFG